jgi:hypothetical protein
VAELLERDAKLVRAVTGSQRWFAALGLALALLGAAYAVWGVARFDPYADPRQNPGFDKPVAELAFLFDRGLVRLENQTPQTQMEAFLLRGLTRNMQFSAGVMILIMRIFLGLFVLVTGLLSLTVVVERGRLLRVIQRLRE